MTEVTDAPQFQEPVAVAPASTDDAPAPAEPEAKPERTPDQYKAEIEKLRREAANYRTKLKEVEPIAKKAQEAAEAEKTEIQRANDRAQAAEQRLAEREMLNNQLELAVQHSIPPQYIPMIGTGSREEMEANAKELAALTAAAAKANPPPTDRPMEGLRPGASPEPAAPPDDSYPSQWTPKHVRDNPGESRIIHGQ